MTTDNRAALLEALPVAAFTVDTQGRITSYNAAAAALWGSRPDVGSRLSSAPWRLTRPDGSPLPYDGIPAPAPAKDAPVGDPVEAICERADGTLAPVALHRSALTDESGRVIGAINLLVEAAERSGADIDLARLAAIVECSDDAIVSKTLDGRITSWNVGAERIFGYQASEMIGQPIIRIIPPELHEEERRILGKLERGERITHYETVRIAKDGHRIAVSLTVSPLRDKAGRVIGASKIARDVSERKQAEALQRLLVEELNHRVKNTLATVQAIASQSLRLAKDPRDFIASFTGRVRSLARAHNLLVETRLQGVDMLDLVREQVLLEGSDDTRIAWSGPRLVLDPQVAVHLAMVLHELATNARKYGALSVAEGRLVIAWEMLTNGGRKLLMNWTESGGPKVSAPDRRGFGTTLIEQTLQGHGGEAHVRYAADGVTCNVRLPLADEGQQRIGTLGASGVLEAAASLLARPQPRLSSLKGKRILLVEDEPLVAMDLEESLTAAGCAIVGPAGNVESAKRLIADGGFDAALLDVNLSGHPVDELAAALTQKHIPFAFVTGYGREALPRGFGQVAMITKPFARDQLLGVTEGLFQHHSQTDIVQLRHK
jgi:PAS domain S-box-containing protein